MPDPTRVLTAGDWHGNTRWARAVIDLIPELLPGEANPVILHAGDFGIWPGGNGNAYLKNVTNALAEHNAELWFVDGNHEDHDRLARERWGHQPDEAVRITRNVTWLPRGHRWTWHDRSWLAMGGATSVDRPARAPGVSWWPDEAITIEQATDACDAGPADVMVTHDCPDGVPLNLPRPAPAWWELGPAEAHRELLRRIVDTVRPSWLIHGHYHLFHQTDVDFGYPLQVTGLNCDDTLFGNYRVLNVTDMTWEQP